MMAEEFSRYWAFVSRLALQGLAPAGADPPAPAQGAGAADLAVSLAAPAARLMLEDDPASYIALAEGWRLLAVAGAAGTTPGVHDGAGHVRDVYHPLVLHLHLAALERCYAILPPGLKARIEPALPMALAPYRAMGAFADTPPSPAERPRVLWQALCLAQAGRVLGRAADAQRVRAVVETILAHPGPGGALSPLDPQESLEGWTWRELTGLHALAALALLERWPRWLQRVHEVAAYHVENTQPDHATAQPWALAAFARWPDTSIFADQQIEALMLQGGPPAAAGQPRRAGHPLSALLLADAAASLAQAG